MNDDWKVIFQFLVAVAIGVACAYLWCKFPT